MEFMLIWVLAIIANNMNDGEHSIAIGLFMLLAGIVYLAGGRFGGGKR